MANSSPDPILRIRWPPEAKLFSLMAMGFGVWVTFFGGSEIILRGVVWAPRIILLVLYGSLPIGAIVLAASFQKINVYADRIENFYFGFRRTVDLMSSSVREEKAGYLLTDNSRRKIYVYKWMVNGRKLLEELPRLQRPMEHEHGE